MAGFERAVQSLRDIEEKLRKAFNLAGPIGAALKSDLVTPVVIAHDLREPGHATHAGRCWTWRHTQAGTPAGVNVLSMLFGADVLIECLYVSGTIAAATPMEAYITTPSEVIPIATTATVGTWRDRRVVTADTPPIATNNAAWGALTGTAIADNNVVQVWGAQTAVTSIRRCSIMVPAGGTLTWRSAGANAECRVGAWGRIWP